MMHANRNRLFVGGGILVAAFCMLSAFALILWLVVRPREINTAQGKLAVNVLSYCNEEGLKPCVASFTSDPRGGMRVNILVPDLSYPGFILQITRSTGSAEYECDRVSVSPNTVRCIGEQMPPGEQLHLVLLSAEDETLLAEGDLSILGLAFPTLSVVTQTATSTVTPTPTQTSIFTQTPEGTPTLPVSYP
jgi:hypothetical protein